MNGNKVNGESIFNDHDGNLFITHIVKIEHIQSTGNTSHFFPIPQAYIHNSKKFKR